MGKVIRVDSNAISFDKKTNELIILGIKPLLLDVNFKTYNTTTCIEVLESRFGLNGGDELSVLKISPSIMYNKGISYDGNNLKLNASRNIIIDALKTDDLSNISFSFIINNMNELTMITGQKNIALDTSLDNIVHTPITLIREHMEMVDIYYKPFLYDHKFDLVDINRDGVIIDFVIYNKGTRKTYPISRKKEIACIRYDSSYDSIILSNKELVNISIMDIISTEYYGYMGLVAYFAKHDGTSKLTLMKLEYRCYVDDSTFIVHGVKEENPNDDNFIDRIHIELKELEEKFNKLSAFLETDVYKKMDSEEHKFLLYNQHIAMNLYVKTLKARLFLLEKKI